MNVTSSVFSDANSQHTHIVNYFWNNEYNDPGYQACTEGANFSLSQILSENTKYLAQRDNWGRGAF